MGSVIRILTQYRVGGDVVVFHPTWQRRSKLRTMYLTATAAFKICRMKHDEIAHLHFSEGGSFLREGALLILASRRRLSTVATLHGADFLGFASRHSRLTSTVLRRARVITCLDREVLVQVRRMAPKVKVEILPNPVQIDDDAVCADQTLRAGSLCG